MALAKEQNNTLLKTDVHFFHSNLLQNTSVQYDMIVANLPYLSQIDIDTSPTKEELLTEPRLALYADDDGLFLIKQLIEQSADKLTNNGFLFLELKS